MEQPETPIARAFATANLTADLEAERASRQAFVIAYIDLLVERELLSADVARLTARVAELEGAVAEAPVPFTLVEPVRVVGGTSHLSAVPTQRQAGEN